MNLYESIFFRSSENGIPLLKGQRPPLFKMPQCMGLKSDGVRCERQDSGFIHLDATHLHFCRTHWGVYERRVGVRRQLTVVAAEQHHHVGTCHKWVANQRWCGRVCVEGGLLCLAHAANEQQRRQREIDVREALRLEADSINTAVTWYRQRQMTWRQVIDDLTAPVGNPNLPRRVMFRVARRMFLDPLVIEADFNQEWQFNLYWNWAFMGRNGPAPNLHELPRIQTPPPRPNVLAAISRDAQNVHTLVVSQQTNKGLEKLLEASKTTKTIRSPEWFAAKWLVRGYGHWNITQRIVQDILHWYNQAYCKTANDYLYRRTLDGLYIMISSIKDTDTRVELYKRVFEECYESVGMCCEGHISRLCNVLVGFDDAFAPPVLFGDILQNKMASIAALEVDTEEKVRQATAFFNEFAVPLPEREAWLEAF